MNIKTLYNLSYGLYIIGAKNGDRNVGCVVNTVMQSTSDPITLTVCINKDNFTNACVKETKEFAVSILSENTKGSTIGTFGFYSSREKDKFAESQFALTPKGLPYINEGVTGWLQCEVIDFVDNFTHTIFIAKVTEAENLCNEPPMTYAYYHSVLKGKTPPKAPSYISESESMATKSSYINESESMTTKQGYINGSERTGMKSSYISESESMTMNPNDISENERASMKKYTCRICGYVYDEAAGDSNNGIAPGTKWDDLPDDFVCPICGASKDNFSIK